MGNVDKSEKKEFTDEEFFHLGLGRFLVQEPRNAQRVISEKLVDFSMKNQMAVESEFFLEMTDLGKEVWRKKLEEKKENNDETTFNLV